MTGKTENITALSIPEWTADDYRSTTTPFEWLYAHKDDKFIMAQLVDRVKQQAGGVGVKNFITLWRAYLETRNKANGQMPAENITEFDNQPVELYCGEYTCDDDGITYINKYGAEVIVCRHPLLPIHRLQNIDTGEIKLELAYRRGAQWKTIIVEKGVLASSQKIIELARYGIAVDSQNAGDLVAFITYIEEENYMKLGETNSVGRLGWIDGCGFSPYVDNLRFDGDITFAHTFDAVKPHGDYRTWLNLVKEIRQSKSIANIQIAASFASVLVEPLGCLPFFLHSWGGTEAGKTVGLMVAASVWANPSMGEYIKTFNSTSVGQEMIAGFLNSLPLCLDELQIIKDRKDFDKDIYMLTEGIGRSRGAKTGGLQKIQTWRNCILTTGEMPITNSNSGGGAVNRVIEVDCKDEKFFADPRSVANIVRQHYGHAGQVFVNEVVVNRKEVNEIYSRLYAGLVTGASTEKQAMAAALILTADELIEKWIFHDGCKLNISDIEQHLTKKDDVDMNKRALNFIYELVTMNPIRFKDTDNPGEMWGTIDRGTIYIIKNVFDNKMQEAGYNPTSFLSWAKRNKIILCDDKRTTKVKRFNGTDMLTRCVAIVKDAQIEWDDIGGIAETVF